MDTHSSLTNHFLIAMPQLADPNFHHTVTYICGHNEEGAMGIVVNRPLDMDLGELLGHMEIETGDEALRQREVFIGGPVESEHGFVLHSPEKQWKNTLVLSDDVALTTSSDILRAMAAGEGPEKSLVALGYAGWGAGQLEQEMADNAWLSVPADPAILFDTPVHQRWQGAAALLGIDLANLSDEVGHA